MVNPNLFGKGKMSNHKKDWMLAIKYKGDERSIQLFSDCNIVDKHGEIK
jgi:hypothetical protein